MPQITDSELVELFEYRAAEQEKLRKRERDRRFERWGEIAMCSVFSPFVGISLTQVAMGRSDYEPIHFVGWIVGAMMPVLYWCLLYREWRKRKREDPEAKFV